MYRLTNTSDGKVTILEDINLFKTYEDLYKQLYTHKIKFSQLEDYKFVVKLNLQHADLYTYEINGYKFTPINIHFVDEKLELKNNQSRLLFSTRTSLVNYFKENFYINQWDSDVIKIIYHKDKENL